MQFCIYAKKRKREPQIIAIFGDDDDDAIPSEASEADVVASRALQDAGNEHAEAGRFAQASDTPRQRFCFAVLLC